MTNNLQRAADIIRREITAGAGYLEAGSKDDGDWHYMDGAFNPTQIARTLADAGLLAPEMTEEYAVQIKHPETGEWEMFLHWQTYPIAIHGGENDHQRIIRRRVTAPQPLNDQ